MSQLDAFERVEGKTLTFWLRNPSVRLSLPSLITELVAEGRNTRACLHASPDALLHDMLIVEWREQYTFPMHRHKKAECLQIISGAMRLCLRSADGELSEALLCTGDGANICAGIWHRTVPATDYVGYREMKLGPFTPADNEMWVGGDEQ